jgi:hypothetical protein
LLQVASVAKDIQNLMLEKLLLWRQSKNPRITHASLIIGLVPGFTDAQRRRAPMSSGQSLSLRIMSGQEGCKPPFCKPAHDFDAISVLQACNSPSPFACIFRVRNLAEEMCSCWAVKGFDKIGVLLMEPEQAKSSSPFLGVLHPTLHPSHDTRACASAVNRVSCSNSARQAFTKALVVDSAEVQCCTCIVPTGKIRKVTILSPNSNWREVRRGTEGAPPAG